MWHRMQLSKNAHDLSALTPQVNQTATTIHVRGRRKKVNFWQRDRATFGHEMRIGRVWARRGEGAGAVMRGEIQMFPVSLHYAEGVEEGFRDGSF